MPGEVRRYLGVIGGDQVESVSEDGRLFVRPLCGDNPFLAFAGTRPQGLSRIEDLNAFVHDLRDEDAAG